MKSINCARASLAASVIMSSFNCFGQKGYINGNEFNPALSLILDGRYTEYNNDLELPGFQLGGESELPSKGFGLGHSELTMSANVDDRFYGSASLAFHEHDGASEVELEEAYLETLGLGFGSTIKFGRFLSDIGYVNSQHEHAWDFYDAPLVYTAMFGKSLYDDGVQLRWLAPTDLYLEFGLEITRGEHFPGGENDGNEGRAAFIKTGGDITINASWQVGLSGYSTEYLVRESETHGHAHDDQAELESELAFENGEVDIAGVDAVFKWAPTGNATQQQVVIQAEYFERKEKGETFFSEETNSLLAAYDGKQSGFYIQAVYRFMPQWRTGIRYDEIEANNQFTTLESNGIDLDEFLEETELGSDETITRESIMIEYAHSEFSRVRLQYNHRDWGEDQDDLWVLQYTMSLGSHGAHRY